MTDQLHDIAERQRQLENAVRDVLKDDPAALERFESALEKIERMGK